MQSNNSESSIEKTFDDKDNLKSFIDFYNYSKYFDDKVPSEADGECSDEIALAEVNKLVDAFESIQSTAKSNKETFNNLNQLLSCRGLQHSTFYYHEVDSHPGIVFNAVDDIKTDSKFLKRLIDRIKYKEVKNGLVGFVDIDNPFDQLLFLQDVVKINPEENLRLCEYAMSPEADEMKIFGVDEKLYNDNAYEKIGKVGDGSLDQFAVELEVLELFGVTMIDVEQRARERLFDWAIDLTESEYDRLKNITSGMPFNSRVEIANAFIATEFGNEFGDRLLAIGDERSSDSIHIFEQINSIRNQSTEIANYFRGNAIDLSNEIGQAWIKRTTEVLAILDDKNISESEKQQAISALEILNFSTEKINQALKQDLVDVTDFSSSKNEAGFVSLKAPNGVVITLRPNQKEADSSQRIGFTVIIPKELIPESIKKHKERRLSLRLDRDLYGLSLDIGSSASLDRDIKVADFIGRVLSRGEYLIGKTKNGNHVREAFSSQGDFSSADFEILVNEFASKIRLPEVNLPTVIPDQEKNTA